MVIPHVPESSAESSTALLERAQHALVEESAALGAGESELASLLVTASVLVDHVRRVVAHSEDTYYAQEKADVVLREAFAFWSSTRAGEAESETGLAMRQALSASIGPL